MKCKVNESPSSGLGRPRTTLISAVHSSSRSKINNNDVSAVRRSSRRATIERRVWAVPKKGNKFYGTTTALSAKKKDNNQNKRDRKPSISDKIGLKSNIKSKGSSGTKRGASLPEESEQPRKKAKKKMPVEDVLPVAKSESALEIDDTYSEVECDEHFDNIDEKVENEGSSSHELGCTKANLDCETYENTSQQPSAYGDERTRIVDELDSEKVDLVDASQGVYTDSKCDIGKEETLCIDNVCLHKAVIVEVVSDYGRSDIKETCATDLGLRGDISDELVSHKVLEVGSDISKEICEVDQRMNNLDSSSSPKDFSSGVKDESVESLLSDMDKYPIRPEKPRTALKMEPKWTSSITSRIKGQCENSKRVSTSMKAISILKSSSVKSMHKSSFEKGSDTSNMEGPSGLSGVLVNVESDKDTARISFSSSCVSSEPKVPFQNSPVVKSKDSFPKVDKELVLNGDTLMVERNLKCNQQSKEMVVLTDGDSVQNGFNRKVLIPKNQSTELTGDRLGHSYILVDPAITNVEENQQSLKLEQTDSGFDPGGVHKTDLPLNNCKKLLSDVEANVGSLSYVSNVKSDKEIKDSVNVLAKQVDKICESSKAIDEISNEKYSCKKVVTIEKSDGISNSGSACESENDCIPDLDSIRKRGDCLKEVCNQNESRLDLLQLDEPDMEVGEEGHVSLSVALAQLVDAGSSDEDDGAETLTIHSAAALTQVSEERKEMVSEESNEMLIEESEEIQSEDREEIVKVECDIVDENKKDLLNEEDLEEDEGKLFIKEDEEEEILKSEEEPEAENEFQDEQEEVAELADQSAPSMTDSEERDHVESEENPPDSSAEKTMKVEEETQPLNLQKPKKQIPPLIKINSRPPTIKTPLKCPECPMQFCTVRSLFWHFGLHGARSQEMSLPPILLQDLLVPWDKASTSRFLSQAQELLDKAEKSLNMQELDKVSDVEKVLSGLGTHDIVPPLVSSSATSVPHITSTASVCQFSSSSSCDNNQSIEKYLEKDQTPPLQFPRHEDSSGSNVDVILKIPIPRLKRKLQVPPSLKMDKFVNILPKLPNKKLPISRSLQANHQSGLIGQSSSPPPQVTLQPSSSLDLVTVTPQPSIIPKITVIPNSSSQVHIQPLSSSGNLMPLQSIISSQPVVSTPSLLSSQSLLSSNHLASSSQLGLSLPGTTNDKTTSATSHITLIPMDNIPSASHTHQGSKGNPKSMRMIAPSQLPPSKESNSLDGVVEKDGLVMINSNLALRIVSSLPTTLDTTTTTTNTTTIHPITNPSLNNLTILPQMDGGKSHSSLRDAVKNPDILTIVPQVDLSKRLSLLKNKSSVSSTPSTSCTTTTTTAGSQVVKLYLLQSKKSNSLNIPKLKIPDAFKNRNGVEFKPFSIVNGREKETSLDEEEEAKEDCLSDDEGNESMVISDIKEEIEEDLMDPLSLCAVTMEDEHLELSNHANSLSQSSVTITSVENDKASDKLELKGRVKKEKLDIVKYEARKYVCCFCNRRFGWSTDLKRHVILHTGERPFQCKVCPTAFTRKFLLQNHMKRMHPDKCKMSDLWP